VDITTALFGQLIASDLSQGMLAVLTRRVERLGLTNVTPLLQDACDLRDIATGSVDVVYSVGLLETVADFSRLFAETYRVLRPGGLVAGITSNGDCPWYRLRAHFEGGQRHARTGYLVKACHLGEILGRAGFASPAITYWGAVPPGLRHPFLIRALTGIEAVVARTRLARRLGVLSFSARKPANRGSSRIPKR
jgi:SAM-dependent methyltransferase